MSSSNEPLGAPPPYQESAAPPGPPHRPNNLNVPNVPQSFRRSMEDESRPLPPHWVRQYDAQEHHQFFVDTSANPPRSIWCHPYDDEAYLASISPQERERIRSLHAPPKGAPPGHSDDEDWDGWTGHENDTQAPAQAGQPGDKDGGKKSLGRKLKDKLTSSTHEEREAERAARDEEERKMYERHQKIRQAMAKAAQTGEPQLLGKDKNGRDVYVEPPDMNSGFGGGFGGLGGAGYGGGGGLRGGRSYPGNGYGYSPYSSGIYGQPNARYLRPQQPYGRPGYGGGYGYGGGMGGMGMGAPLLGLGGGMLLGGLLF